MPCTRWYALVFWLSAVTAWVPQTFAQSRYFVVDLTHPIPTFQQGDVGQADLSKPFGNSRPIASFSPQAVLIGLPNFPTGDGHYTLNRIILGEHHGTPLDAPGHFVNKPETTEMPAPDRRTTDQLESKDLRGRWCCSTLLGGSRLSWTKMVAHLIRMPRRPTSVTPLAMW